MGNYPDPEGWEDHEEPKSDVELAREVLDGQELADFLRQTRRHR